MSPLLFCLLAPFDVQIVCELIHTSFSLSICRLLHPPSPQHAHEEEELVAMVARGSTLVDNLFMYLTDGSWFDWNNFVSMLLVAKSASIGTAVLLDDFTFTQFLWLETAQFLVLLGIKDRVGSDPTRRIVRAASDNFLSLNLTVDPFLVDCLVARLTEQFAQQNEPLSGDYQNMLRSILVSSLLTYRASINLKLNDTTYLEHFSVESLSHLLTVFETAPNSHLHVTLLFSKKFSFLKIKRCGATSFRSLLPGWDDCSAVGDGSRALPSYPSFSDWRIYAVF